MIMVSKSFVSKIMQNSIPGEGVAMRHLRTAQAAGALLLLALCSCAPPRSKRIVVGAKNFTEQVVLGELLAQEIEAVYAQEGHPQRVARRFYLAGSYICQQALASGRIMPMSSYTGTRSLPSSSSRSTRTSGQRPRHRPHALRLALSRPRGTAAGL